MTQAELSRRSAARSASLMCGASVAIMASFFGAPVLAQTNAATTAAAPATTDVTEVIVTGSSIRGAPPVGAAVTVVGQAEIQKTASTTVQQILRSVPAVVGLSAVGQGSFGTADGSNTNTPTIHGLGASASNSTLILIDGHRFPLSGVNHALPDPNIVPPNAIERVEVLAEGASSVYGSDAVAGVVNFITRRNFDGVEASGQATYGDKYHGYSAGLLGGKTWDTGSALVAYYHSDRSALSASARSFTHADQRPLGGSNLASFFCAPATIQVGAGNIFTSPYAGAGLANAATNAPCDFSGLADIVPSEKRDSVMVKLHQEVTDKLTLSGDVVYSNRTDSQKLTRGTIQATIFGPGSANTSQINPFFVGIPGNPATAESIRFDADQLLGPGAKTDSGEQNFYASGNAEYKFNDNWRFTAGGVVGASDSKLFTHGQLCGSCALLALNGTTNGAGSLTAASIPGTTTTILNTPLTAANALDVFNLGSANRTSTVVLASLADNVTLQTARNVIEDGTVKLDGSLFDLPGGPVRVAIGGEIVYYTLEQNTTRPLGIGPSTTGSGFLHLNYDRNVRSAFAEVLVPLVSPDMNVPLMRRVDLNLSGRYDKYSDVGSTSNPKIGANWEVIEGLKFRANWGKSFVAPAFTSKGADANGTTSETNITAFAGTLNVPVAAYPQIVGLPGCSAGAVTCTIGGSINGLQINGGNAGVQPEHGKSWSVGADWDPTFVHNLRLSLTFWHNDLLGAITAPQAAFAVNAAGLNSLLQIFPGGATPAQIAAATAGRPLQTTIPAQVFFTYNFTQRNALNLEVEGIDGAVDYAIDTDVGQFSLNAVASLKTKFNQQVGTGGAVFSVLGTTGFNTTFPSIELDSRTGVDWASKFGVVADLFWNHTSSYHNWSGTTVTPITKNAAGVPTGGGDLVKANNTIDAHVAYNFTGDSYTKGLQVYLDVENLFDKAPPFYNTANGFDPFGGNPLGRLTSVGFRKRW
jgi:iron complex outermembrane receptor protein